MAASADADIQSSQGPSSGWFEGAEETARSRSMLESDRRIWVQTTIQVQDQQLHKYDDNHQHFQNESNLGVDHYCLDHPVYPDERNYVYYDTQPPGSSRSYSSPQSVAEQAIETRKLDRNGACSRINTTIGEPDKSLHPRVMESNVTDTTDDTIHRGG
ncbi:hypothetical protein EDD11_009709 [Mortierella claussenii]|nr:hypothetical protein EDD11_009709 [Mortierella claussenii]